MHIVGLIFGLAALYFGAEWLVRGAARLASALGVRPVVIGLTVVGFGTSMPEVVVSALASARGQADIALGNVVGSNIANLGLILGLAALASPMKSDLGVLRREGPLMVGVSVAAWALAWTGEYSRWQGVLMLVGLGLFVFFSLRWARREQAAVEAGFERYGAEHELLARVFDWRALALLAAGLATVIAGGYLLVESAVLLARKLDVPEFVISVTLVAVGTSLPELATSLVAALRRQADISVGTLVGSNIFNLLGVLGLSAAIRPLAVATRILTFELVWMVGFALAAVLILRTGQRVTRAEGGLLLAAYAVFLFLVFR